MSKKIEIINGPNINLLGKREPNIYGDLTLERINKEINGYAKELNFETFFFQSNIEGEIVNKIQQVRSGFHGVIINAAGFTHTSVSIRDALEILKIPIIEVHISNIYKREEFRRKSLLSGVVTGGIFGLGTECYILAIKALQSLMKNGNW